MGKPPKGQDPCGEVVTLRPLTELCSQRQFPTKINGSLFKNRIENSEINFVVNAGKSRTGENAWDQIFSLGFFFSSRVGDDDGKEARF